MKIRRWLQALSGWRRRYVAGEVSLGARGEQAAAEALKRAGYRILARNLRSRFGEADLLAEDAEKRYLVIVEVKATVSDDPPPESHVNPAKQRKLTGVAGQIMRRYGLSDRIVRFDVVAVVWPNGASTPSRLTHHINAFEAAY